MKYQDCLEHLEQLGNEVVTMRPGLESIRKLLQEMGNPQVNYPNVLVAGTNGKGSIARFIASIAGSCGLVTGRFSSPHLVTVRERICLHETPLPREAFAESFDRVQTAARTAHLPHPPTYFETLCATALDYFSCHSIDLAVLEVGLGGRLDSTNAVDPVLSVLGPIGLDHQSRLGKTIPEIASEKAGIIRPSTPVVSAPQPAGAESVIRETARKSRAPLSMIDSHQVQAHHVSEGRYRIDYGDIQAGLSVVGQHQGINAAVAIDSVKQLERLGWDFPGECIAQGLASVRPFGVLQRIARQPDVFVDGGHNPDAARAVASFLTSHTRAPRYLVFSMMQDKDLRAVSEILTPLFEQVYLVELTSTRAASASRLKKAFPQGVVMSDLKRALTQARRRAASVLVFGSFRLAGKVLAEREALGNRWR